MLFQWGLEDAVTIPWRGGKNWNYPTRQKSVKFSFIAFTRSSTLTHTGNTR